MPLTRAKREAEKKAKALTAAQKERDDAAEAHRQAAETLQEKEAKVEEAKKAAQEADAKVEALRVQVASASATAQATPSATDAVTLEAMMVQLRAVQAELVAVKAERAGYAAAHDAFDKAHASGNWQFAAQAYALLPGRAVPADASAALAVPLDDGDLDMPESRKALAETSDEVPDSKKSKKDNGTNAEAKGSGKGSCL